MQFKTLTYSRTVNLGNFNSGKFEASVELEEGDDETQAALKLKTFVEDAAFDRLKAEGNVQAKGTV